MAPTQENRVFSVSIPSLGPDVLLFSAMSGTEALGRLYQYDLQLLSENFSINLDDVLGQSMTISMQLSDGSVRYFDGLVARFSQVGNVGAFASYHVTLYPWLWFLTRTSDCRIFQNMTVPEIIKQVFRDCGYTDFEVSLSGNYRTWEYCVQYRETDFNFVSRLMEQEGIYYYFLHQDGKHILKMTDSISGHDPIVNPDVAFLPPSENVVEEQDHITSWSFSRDVQPGAVVNDDYDFKNPKANLEAKLSSPFPHNRSDNEIYDYPGEYYNAGDGNNYVRTRLQEMHAQYERSHGEGSVHTIYTGGLFNLTEYPRDDQNREYMVVGCSYQLKNDEYESTGIESEIVFNVSIEAMDSKTQFRTARTTPKPMVQGPQTAVVTGPTGDEIWTDKYGRVKVQFHWDRYGDNDENSSCWIRVSNPWAGKNWGAIALPRIGHEVIVDFLEGDPDQPIITGRVYNQDNMPPYTLPANQTQSGMKSRSSKGGTGENFNEIRFEDLKGKEEIYIHAEKDQLNEVENNEITDVGNDRTEHVAHDEVINIDNDRTETVGNNENITIENDRTENVTNNENVTIGKERFHKIGTNDTLDVGDNLYIKAGKSIILETGAAKIDMQSNGDILISGANITVKGSAKVTQTAEAAMTIKGNPTAVN